ncbi:anion transporter [Desulfosporosinus sp. BG]|uniref:anion transporter n=1 Tax=Desulfosporosinus sp. BG TaxID=1633135 RepID=UPI00083A1A73|nr:anion transporter [Desulfosporosinus sp. BG]ODA38718.1 Arsenic efflux pump protein [Desulfosporosinus sp. BG]
MIVSTLILMATLLIFTVGKSPIFRVDRAGVAIIGASLTIATGMTFDQAVGAVDYRTIVLLFSMMIITSYLNLSGLFQLVGNYSMSKLHTKKQLLFVVLLLTGILSAFFINDIVCLLFTPVVILICRRMALNPIPYLLGVATASNIGSMATLIGNPHNILIGSLSHMPFNWYMTVAVPLSLVGLMLNYMVIAWVYREELNGLLPNCSPIIGVVHRYLIRKGLVVMVLVLTGFLIGFDPAVVASLGAALLLITRRLKPNKVYAGIDFNLLVIFIGLFVIIGGVEQSGLIGQLLNPRFVQNVQSLPLFTVLTILFSNVVSNVPAVMMLKFLIPTSSAHVWWASMAVFSTLAGNLTLTGSIANLIVVEQAKKQNVDISFSTYLKIGFPLTIVLVVIGSVYFRLLFGL